MRDLHFTNFDWRKGPDGDLARAEGLLAFRDLVLRWLVTEPSEDGTGLVAEEVERRRKFRSPAERARGYAAPAGEEMRACLPWDPAFGAGIKRELGKPMTVDLLARLRATVVQGLAGLDGVREVVSVRTSSASTGRLTVAWQVRTDDFGVVGDTTTVEAV